VLDVGAADRRRPLGPQRHAVAAAVLEDVHLLLRDVGLLAHGAQEDAGVLDDGRGDITVVEEPGDTLGGVADVPPGGGVLREQVLHASGRLQVRHAGESMSRPGSPLSRHAVRGPAYYLRPQPEA